jgi:hypothetical protein
LHGWKPIVMGKTLGKINLTEFIWALKDFRIGQWLTIGRDSERSALAMWAAGLLRLNPEVKWSNFLTSYSYTFDLFGYDPAESP